MFNVHGFHIDELGITCRRIYTSDVHACINRDPKNRNLRKCFPTFRQSARRTIA